jgi:quercetin dioxygenase-like cupin family protein
MRYSRRWTLQILNPLDSFRLSIQNPSESILIQDAAYSEGGVNGWHSHPGLVAVTLITGTIEWYDANCKMAAYQAGDSWTEGSQVHYFKVTGTNSIHLMATFVHGGGLAGSHL